MERLQKTTVEINYGKIPSRLWGWNAEFLDRANKIRQHFIDILLRNLTGTKFTLLHSQQDRQKHTLDLHLTLALLVSKWFETNMRMLGANCALLYGDPKVQPALSNP